MNAWYKVLNELEEKAENKKSFDNSMKLREWKEFMKTGKMAFCFVDYAEFWVKVLLKNNISFAMGCEARIINLELEDPDKVSITTVYTIVAVRI